MVFLQFVLTFAVPTLRPYLDARMPAALDDGAWTNVVAYALVCVPTGLAFQAVSAGNVPGAPLSWSAFSVVGLGLFTYASVRRYDDFAGSYEDRSFLVVNPITGAVAVGLHLAILVAVATGRDADWLQHWRRLRAAPRSVDAVVEPGRRARPADYVGDLLPEAAKLLRTVQRDLNVSAKVAVPLASLLMLRFFLMSLGYIILENALVFFIFACVNEYPRGVLWDHRLTLVVFAAASAFMGCVVDPLVMHGYCSGGYSGGGPRQRWPQSYVARLVGAALFVSRVLTSVVFCLFHLVSLDVCVLPERYAHLDASHVAFMSLVYAHRRHHDAALHVAAEAFAARKPRHSRARTRSFIK
ncbi:hypothetical protein JL721_8081 [Aureococcus anophagefferens]|nr:hypothetical protein JL721_8081 [Aureococcus anophagefferens]